MIIQNTISIAPSIIEGFSANGKLPASLHQSSRQTDRPLPARQQAKLAGLDHRQVMHARAAVKYKLVTLAGTTAPAAPYQTGRVPIGREKHLLAIVAAQNIPVHA
jgi:hypothetical protein